MAFCFGLDSGPQLPRFPADRLIENRPRIDARMLARAGALTPGTVSEVGWGGKRWVCRVREADILVDGTAVPIVRDRQARPYFECTCGRACRLLVLPELRCKTCLPLLDYTSRRRYRSIPGLWRAIQLRRRWGLSPEPFSPIPRKQRHHLRYARAADEIRRLELGLVEHLRSDVNDVLRRRIRLRTPGRRRRLTDIGLDP